MGYGDSIMATAEARELFARNGRKVAIGDGTTVHWDAEVFANNPHLAAQAEVDAGAPVNWLANYSGARPYIDYEATKALGRAALGRDGKPKELLKAAGRWVFNPAYRVRAGEIVFTDAERSLGDTFAHAGDCVLIEPHIKANAPPGKAWGVDRYAEVVNRLRGTVRFIQCGPDPARRIPGVTFVITPTFRTALVLLSQARLYLGAEGGMHHAAAALGIPAVVIFGGFVSPAITGYRGHVNLAGTDTFCGSRSYCSHCDAAMAAIEVGRVAEAVETELSNRRG